MPVVPCRTICGGLVAAGLLWLAGTALAAAPIPLRLGFSSAAFGEVNRNDAVVAMKIWVNSLAEQSRVTIAPQAVPVEGTDALGAGLRDRQLDGVNLAADEYAALRSHLASDYCILGIKRDQPTEEYLLVVRRGAIRSLADLRGCSLVLLDTPKMRLGKTWIETLLLRERLGHLGDFCRVAEESKLTRAALSVFFRKSDACILTRLDFQTMVEMNPQLGQELAILLHSPALVPFVFAFRADYDQAVRDELRERVSTWHHSVKGRQILTVFQCERLEPFPLARLDDTLALLAEHARLFP